jgi:hypothetical protein
MKRFIERFRSSILGVLSGFDRLMFRGHLEGLVYPKGLMNYLWERRVLWKDFASWAKERTDALKARTEEDAARLGQEVVRIARPSDKKEKLARKVQLTQGITDGTVAFFSCLEPCQIWKVRGNRKARKLVPVWSRGQCLHLYRYIDDPRFGFMHVRLQTWFPFTIQVWMNGREFLRRALSREGLAFQMYDNSFTFLEDWPRAQRLMDKMLDLDWIRILNGFANQAFPMRRRLLGDIDYRWSVFQSEWATDVTFDSEATLNRLFPALVRHALATSDTARVLHYLGQPVTAAGTAYANLRKEVATRLVRRAEGTCIKHCVGFNGIKAYNKGRNLRDEATINDPRGFKVFRCAQGGDGTKDWRTLRSGVADLKRRAEVSQGIVERYLDHQATACTDQPLGNLLAGLSKPVTWKKARLRALDLPGKDRFLADLLADPAVAINGVRNSELRERLRAAGRAAGKTDRQLSGMATRLLRLLRAHGIIRKVSKSHRYQLTDVGRLAVSAVKSALAASVEKLISLAA